MNTQIENLLILLKSSVHSECKPVLQEPVEWEKILSLAAIHNLFPIVFEKACEISEFKLTPEYQKWQIEAIKLVGAQSKRTEHFLRLYMAFIENDIYPIVVKGLICRNLYGNLCNHRLSGDEDILIQKKDYNRAKNVLLQQGYVTQFKDLTNEQVRDLQEVSFYDLKNKLHIELHLNLMGNDDALRKQMDSYFTNVFDHCIEVEIKGVKIKTMNHSDHFQFLVLHAFKHFVTGGFGIRQMMDILVYYEHFAAEINMEQVRKNLKEVDAELFLSDLMHIGNRYLGFELPEFLSPNCLEELLDDMIRSGVFGSTTQEQRTAINMTMAAVAQRGNTRKTNSVKVLFRTIFPGRAELLNHHPQLNDKPWLLPVVWIQRFGRFIRHNKEKNGSLMADSIKISNRRIKLLKKYKIL